MFYICSRVLNVWCTSYMMSCQHNPPEIKRTWIKWGVDLTQRDYSFCIIYLHCLLHKTATPEFVRGTETRTVVHRFSIVMFIISETRTNANQNWERKTFHPQHSPQSLDTDSQLCIIIFIQPIYLITLTRELQVHRVFKNSPHIFSHHK